MSLVDQIMSDLQVLQNEAKKNQPLKQVFSSNHTKLAQQAQEALRQFKVSSPSLTQSQVSQMVRESFPSQLMLKLLQLATQSKPDPKQLGIPYIVVSIVQKLHNLNVIEDQLQLLHCLYLLRDATDEQLQLRLTQCTLQMISPSFIDLRFTEHYEKCLAILFMLTASRNPIVQTTSVTGAQQVIEVLFNSEPVAPVLARNAHNLFMDLVKGMQGQKVVWIQGSTTKGLCRDLLLDIIKQLGVKFHRLDETISKYVTEYISPIVYEEMALDDNDIKFNARRIRAAFRLILHLQRDIPLVKHVSLLFTRTPAMHYLRYWILEGVFELLGDQALVELLHGNPEGDSNQFSYLQHLVHLIKGAAEQPDIVAVNGKVAKQVRFMESNTLDYSEAPNYSTFQFHKIAIDCSLALSEQMLSIAKDHQVLLGQKNYQVIKVSTTRSASVDENGELKQLQTPSSDRQRFNCNPNCKELYSIVEGIWVMLLKVLKRLSKAQTDERLVQTILNIAQIWINITGSIGQLRVRDQFLKFLTLQCTNENANEPLTDKNLQSSKTLFNVAHCLGGIMDVNSWYVVLQTMHVFEGQLSRTQQQASQQETNNESTMWSQELIILQSVLDGLFTQSHLYDDTQLLQVLDALNQVTLGVMEQLATQPTVQQDSRALQFCLNKIIQMASVNWHRVNVFWEFVAAHFSCVANCKQTAFREVAVDSFTQLIEQGFHYFLKAYSAKNQHEEEISPVLKSQDKCWNRKQWQQSLLQPVHEVVKFGGTRNQILIGVLRLLQNNGHEFTQGGFISIIEILSLSCQQQEKDNSYVQTGFQVLQLIVSQYLHALEPKTTKVLLPLIANFRSMASIYFYLTKAEQNISYISINLIWQLADNLSKLQQWSITQEELEELWESVLYNLKDLCLDDAPDVRQSALHIIIQITLINCASFRIEFQVKLLRVCLLTIFDALIGRVAQLQKQQGIFHAQTPKFLSDQQTPKFTKFLDHDLQLQQQHEQQWEETLKLIVSNLSKVVKKLQQVPGYEQYSQDIHNEVFVRLFIMFRFQSLELKHEIARFIRENTQLIVEKLHDQSFEWSKELLIAVNEFLFQKVTDQRELKTLNSKILPELCETYALLMKAYSLGLKFDDNFIINFLESYQQIIDQPCRVNNVNVKMWYDDRYLHDYITDFLVHAGPEQWRFLGFINSNLKKPLGVNLVTDNLLKRFVQIYADVVCGEQYIKQEQHLALLNEYVANVEQIIEQRRDPRQLNQIKAYNNSQMPLWNTCTSQLQRVLLVYAADLNIPSIIKGNLKPLALSDSVPQEALKSNSDLEISWCQFAVAGSPDLIFGYWATLLNGSVYSEKLLYETRRQVISILTNSISPTILPILRTIVEDLLQSFIKDEQVHGSMPLPRWRVQELTFLLQELQKLEGSVLVRFTRSLTQLIATKEQEIKLPLQDLFLEIATVIEKQFN